MRENLPACSSGDGSDGLEPATSGVTGQSGAATPGDERL
jgi:hypothetical protein